MILVTGGTGFVGREVVRELLALGLPVRLLVRDPEKARQVLGRDEAARVKLVKGDALKPETLPEAMAGVSAVIDLIGIIMETSHVTYEQAHPEATRNLLAAAKQAGVTRWVHMSALGTRKHGRSRYHRTKWAAEELVRQSGLDWTIFRPSLIYGHDERDRMLNMLRRVLSFPVDFAQLYSLPLVEGGEPRVQPVSVREVARCCALAPAKEAAIRQTFDLVGPEPMPLREMVFKILHALGKRGLYEEIPLLMIVRKMLWGAIALLPVTLIVGFALNELHGPVVEIGAGVWAVLVAVAAAWRTTIIYSLPGEPAIFVAEMLNSVAPRGLRPSEVLKMAVEDNVGDPAPAARTFGYTPEPFEEGLARIVGPSKKAPSS